MMDKNTSRGRRVRRARCAWAWASLLFLVGCFQDCKGQPSGTVQSMAPTGGSETAADGVQDASDRRRLVFLGDSLTSGYGLAEEQSYPSKVQGLLDDAGLPWEVINAGISGDTTQGGLERLEWVLQTKPDLLFVCLGANDGLRGIEPTVTEQNLMKIVAMAKERDVSVVMAGMRMPANYGPERNAEYEAIFKRVAQSQGVPLLPFLIEGVALDPAFNQDDGIHPNPEGAQRIAGHVFQFVRPFLTPSAEGQP